MSIKKNVVLCFQPVLTLRYTTVYCRTQLYEESDKVHLLLGRKLAALSLCYVTKCLTAVIRLLRCGVLKGWTKLFFVCFMLQWVNTHTHTHTHKQSLHCKCNELIFKDLEVVFVFSWGIEAGCQSPLTTEGLSRDWSHLQQPHFCLYAFIVCNCGSQRATVSTWK